MDLREKVRLAAQRHGVPEDLALDVAFRESRFNQGATSPKGARGVMQLMPGTARDLGVNADDEDQNIDGGVRYLKQQLDTFGGDHRLAKAAYNAGPGNVRKYGGVPPFAETRAYVGDKGGGVEGFDGSDIFGMGKAPASAPSHGGGGFDGAEIFTPPAKPGPVMGALPQRYPAPNFGRPGPTTADQGLGFANESARVMENASKGMEWLASKVGLDKPVNDLNARLNLPSIDDLRQRREAYVAQQGQQGTRPGKIGEFGADVMATLPMRGGPLLTGAMSGALTSHAKTPGGVALDAGIGGAVGRLTAAGSDAAQLAARKLLSKIPKIPQIPQLEETKKALYKAATDSGFTYHPQDVQALAASVRKKLMETSGTTTGEGLPISQILMRRLDNIVKDPRGATLEALDKLRSDAYKMAVDGGGPESILGGHLRSEIDKMMDAYNTPFIKAAREANTQWMKAVDIAKRVTSGDLAAASANSGRNVVNAQRAKIRPTVDPLHSAEVTNWTPDEAAAANRVVRGGKAGNFYREAGNFFRNPMVSAGGMSLGGLFGLHGGPDAAVGAGLAVPAAMQAVGHTLRSAAEKETAKDIAALTNLIAVGGTKQGLKSVPTRASYTVEQLISALRPALVAGSVPALAAAKRPKPKK